MACYIGIDIGTSSTKSLILRSDGKILGTAQAKYDVLRPVLGYSEQNVDDLWRAVKCTLGELAVKFPDAVSQVECIGFSGQMHALVMLDEHNEPLRNAMIWEDQRSLQEVKEILSTVTEEAYCRTTLNKLSTGFLLSSLIWVRNNEPDTFRQIKTLTMIKDYIRYKLSGSIACDTTDAASSGVFDVANRTWAWNIIHALGLPPSIFPQCHEPYEIAGTLLDSVAEEIGLPKGIPMVYGGGDTLMHLVGTGVVSESCPWVSNIGTSCQVTCGTNHPIFDDQYRTNTFCHAS